MARGSWVLAQVQRQGPYPLRTLIPLGAGAFFQ